MAGFDATGIIIRQSNYGEGHRILSIFTEGTGIIRAISYGAGKSKTAAAASSQFLCCGHFRLYKGSGQLMSVDSADVTESFYPVSEDITKLSLAVYLSDITYGLLGEGNADDGILKLYLNSIYALAYRKEPLSKIKTVYELKLMSKGGYRPQTDTRCAVCKDADAAYFDLDKGSTVCAACRGKNAARVNAAVIHAMESIISSDDKKMFSFNANEEMLRYLNEISERYVSAQLDMSFKSLNYYKSMLLA